MELEKKEIGPKFAKIARAHGFSKIHKSSKLDLTNTT